MPVASLITAAYHAEAFIARAVQSVLSQSLKDWEMIVISDDGNDYESTLRQQGINDQRMRYLATGGDGKGPGVARNIGAHAACGEIIVNLDADDWLSSNYLEVIVPAVIRHGAVTPAIRVIDAADNSRKEHRQPEATGIPMTVNEIIGSRPTYAPIAYHARYRNIQWPELHYGEDLLFWLLLYSNNVPVVYEPAAGYYYNYRAGSLSRPGESTTHAICKKRLEMAGWISDKLGNNPIARLVEKWLHSCNAMEEAFGYQIVPIAEYQQEVERRLLDIMREGGS